MSIIEVVRPKSPKALQHFQARHQKGYQQLQEIPDIRQFGREALEMIQNIARQRSPQGFRVLMRVGENGSQTAGEPLAIELIGGEVLRTGIKSLDDHSKPAAASEVDKKPDAECVFDKIISGQIPVKPILNEDGVFIFKPSQMLAPGHLLFIPTRHFRDILSVTDPAFFGSVFAKIAQFAEREEYAGGFILESNNGPWGGQAVQHLHFHLRGGEKLDSPFWQDWQS